MTVRSTTRRTEHRVRTIGLPWAANDVPREVFGSRWRDTPVGDYGAFSLTFVVELLPFVTRPKSGTFVTACVSPPILKV